jgi:signal transduction histidine kinase
LLGAIDVDPEGRLVVLRYPGDPRFADPLSGLYWQISAADGQMLRSRSLWDTTLSLPADDPSPGEVHRHEARGPADARVLTAERGIVLTIGDRPVPVRVAVASDLARVAAARAAFGRELSLALALLAAILAIATAVQVGLGLRPLDALRRGVADVRSGRARRLRPAAPSEVQPLVEEVNALLDAQEQQIERSRGRAADLAHGLKTPLSALAADAGRLRARGEHELARDIEAVGKAMSRQVDRELARARMRSARPGAAVGSTEVGPLVRALIATLARTPAGQRIAFEPEIPDGVSLPFDRTDLAEVLGNLLENAVRHAASRVRVRARATAAGPSITVEDDGEGIAPAARTGVLERGVRLDQRGEGAGLGLAIVLDVLDAYGWELGLETSDLGGLKATISRKSCEQRVD